jgi:hypothetical protein
MVHLKTGYHYLRPLSGTGVASREHATNNGVGKPITVEKPEPEPTTVEDGVPHGPQVVRTTPLSISYPYSCMLTDLETCSGMLLNKITSKICM